jgi:inorganic pyrophosphatase
MVDRTRGRHLVAAKRGPADGLVEVRVEIPRGSRNKYEYDPDRQMFRLDRRLFSATVYPADYGFVPDTLADDGDPLDALVLVDEPTFPGCLIIARPVAVYRLRDEAGDDAKLLCVPVGEPAWDHAQDLDDLPEALLDEIAHSFAVYKTLRRFRDCARNRWPLRGSSKLPRHEQAASIQQPLAYIWKDALWSWFGTRCLRPPLPAGWRCWNASWSGRPMIPVGTRCLRLRPSGAILGVSVR